MTANKMYRNYVAAGGTLGFKDWLDREKKKNFVNFEGSSTVPINKPLTDTIYQTLDQLHRDSGYQDQLSDEYFLGIKKINLFIGATIVAVAIIAVVAYKKTKK